MDGARTAEPEGEGYLASVSDLMVGLLFVFIIVLMAFALNFRTAEHAADEELRALESERDAVSRQLEQIAAERDALAAERDRLLARQASLGAIAADLAERDERRREMLERIAADLARQRVEVAIEPENGLIRLPEDLLFASGEARLSDAGRRTLAVLADSMARIMPCYTLPEGEAPAACPDAAPVLETVLVEGHTDDVPIRGGRYRDNWDLAAARSVNTFKELVERAPALDRLRNVRGAALLGVSAYEARRPIAPGTSDAERRRNRRIDLRFLVAAPSVDDVARIEKELEGVTLP